MLPCLESLQPAEPFRKEIPETNMLKRLMFADGFYQIPFSIPSTVANKRLPHEKIRAAVLSAKWESPVRSGSDPFHSHEYPGFAGADPAHIIFYSILP